MRKLDKIELSQLIFITACVISFTIGIDSKFWTSFYFIREHLFIIVILLFLKPYVNSVFSILLIYGIVAYKIELILYNIILIFLSDEKAYTLNSSYNLVLTLTFSLFLIIFISKFFDKICLIFNRVSKWMKI